MVTRIRLQHPYLLFSIVVFIVTALLKFSSNCGAYLLPRRKVVRTNDASLLGLLLIDIGWRKISTLPNQWGNCVTYNVATVINRQKDSPYISRLKITFCIFSS